MGDFLHETQACGGLDYLLDLLAGKRRSEAYLWLSG
jgi:hypothetical protein